MRVSVPPITSRSPPAPNGKAGVLAKPLPCSSRNHDRPCALSNSARQRRSMHSKELLNMLKQAQDSDLAAQIGSTPNSLAREIVALWTVIGLEKRRDFMAVEAARRAEAEIQEAEATAKREAQCDWRYIHRLAPQFAPDWTNVDYLRVLE